MGGHPHGFPFLTHSLARSLTHSLPSSLPPGKMSLIEKLMYRRFFSRKNELPGIAQWMTQQQHKRIYAEDVLRLVCTSLPSSLPPSLLPFLCLSLHHLSRGGLFSPYPSDLLPFLCRHDPLVIRPIIFIALLSEPGREHGPGGVFSGTLKPPSLPPPSLPPSF
ncbi:hypothetical protein Naga_102542g1, partial [Nannochloropsis gaditana]